MNNSHKLIHCRKCKDITVHELLDTYKVRCLKCGTIKDLRNPHIVEAEIAMQNNPRTD